ncbi:MAG TPA: hypothetical protein VMW72_09265 [Sedimentisphaerales bacterium]|nr:hypothetical protein [Sedimentisphaerales bacterium]
MPDATVSVNMGLSNTDADGLQGIGSHSGGSATAVGLSGGVDLITSGQGDDINFGGEINIGLSTQIPAEVHSHITKTDTTVIFNLAEAFDSVTECTSSAIMRQIYL